MCVVSNVGDHYSRSGAWPTWPHQIPFPDKTPVTPTIPYDLLPRGELARLRAQVEEMKRELEAAKRQDIANGEPDCEMDEKVIILKKIAKLFDIELKEIFPE